MSHYFKLPAIALIIIVIAACTPKPPSVMLPVIRIDTEMAAPILNREDWVTITFSLSDPNNPSNNISPISNQQMRGRGNSTWTDWPKKPYRIRFRKDTKQSLFGLPAARNWVLLANYYDLSLIKTSFAFELGKRLGLPYTCTYNHVELYLNGEYQGSYLLTEHRQVDQTGQGAPGRAAIDLEEGWFAEISWQFKEEPKFRTANYNLPIVIKSPKFQPAAASNPAYNFVIDDWNELTSLMAAESFPENGYRDLIDIPSFIKSFMVYIITNSADFNLPLYEPVDKRRDVGSVFFYKDKGGKISMGPLWDFDLSFGTSWYSYGVGGDRGNMPTEVKLPPELYPYPNYPFFNRFFDDPVFLAKWKEIWNNNFHQNILPMSGFIDDMANKIKASAKKDHEKWWPENDFDTRISELKNYFHTRAAYLNSHYNNEEKLTEHY
ncbi:MAG: CotH kinase family protein [Chitinispirillia bacterium]|nr:CotH kinase family protein [Chitinispirillia bacterium]